MSHYAPFSGGRLQRVGDPRGFRPGGHVKEAASGDQHHSAGSGAVSVIWAGDT